MKPKLVAVMFALAAVLSFLGCDASEVSPSQNGSSPSVERAPSLAGLKPVTELTPSELEVANGICQKVLRDYFGSSAIAWYETTLYYLPTSDEEIVSDVGKKLRTPITVISVTVPVTPRFESLKIELKERVSNLEASEGGRRYSISKSLVLLEPGGGGGSMGMSYDKVTIIPYEVMIY